MDFSKIVSYLRTSFSQNPIDYTAIWYSLEKDSSKLTLVGLVILQKLLTALLQAIIIERLLSKIVW